MQTPQASRPLVLVVDSSAEDQELYVSLFADAGFHVVTATTASEAMDKACTLRPEIIQTSIALRGEKDGCVLVEELKRDPRTKPIPVIVVTAWADGGNVERVRQAGCAAVLTTPCLPETILAAVRPLLETPAATAGIARGATPFRTANP